MTNECFRCPVDDGLMQYLGTFYRSLYDVYECKDCGATLQVKSDRPLTEGPTR